MFEILSGVAFDLKNRTTAHHLGNLRPPSTKLSLQENTPQPSGILSGTHRVPHIQPALNRTACWQGKLTSPSSKSSFSCLDQREEAPETEADVFAADLNIRQTKVWNIGMGHCAHVTAGGRTDLLFPLGLVVSITFPDMIMNFFTCQVVSTSMVSGLTDLVKIVYLSKYTVQYTVVQLTNR